MVTKLQKEIQIDYSGLNVDSFKIAIVKAEFNNKITDKLNQGAKDFLVSVGIKNDSIHNFNVPGAFEIPACCELLAKTEKFHAIVTLGAVIRGETSHYDYVCSETARGIMTVGLEYSIPISFGVLTCENEEQAFDRSGGKYGNKGKDAAQAVLDMLKIQQKIKLL